MDTEIDQQEETSFSNTESNGTELLKTCYNFGTVVKMHVCWNVKLFLNINSNACVFVVIIPNY